MVQTIPAYNPLLRVSESKPGDKNIPAGKGLIQFDIRFLTRYGEVIIDFGELKDLISWYDSLSVEGASGNWSLQMKASLCNQDLLKKVHPGMVIEAYASRNEDPLIGVIRDPSTIQRIDSTPPMPDFAVITPPAMPASSGSNNPAPSSSSADTTMTPRRRAFLDVIAYSEGADYNIMFGGGHFQSYADHPRRVIRSGGYTSSAAGRYQMLIKTWNGLRERLHLRDFSPANQDRGAIELIRGRGALGAVDAGNFEQAVRLCNREWASFPGSPYGQPRRTMAQLRRVYDESLTRYGGAGAAVAAPTPETAAPVATVQPQIPEVIGPTVKPQEDPYLDKCPYLLMRGVVTDYGRTSNNNTSLTVSGQSFGAVYKGAFVLTDLHAAELASTSLEVRNSTLAPMGVSLIYYKILKDWVENFWGHATGWEARTRPIPFPPNYLTRINSEGSAWSNLEFLAIQGFFHIFVDHTGAIVWEKLPWSSKDQSLIAGRNWDDLQMIDLPSWKIETWSDRLSGQGITNFLRCVPTQQGMSGGQDPVSLPGMVYNIGSIRQYGGPSKRELLFPVGTGADQYYTSEPRRKQQATINSFTSLCALEGIRWFDRPVQRVTVSARGEAAWRIHTRVNITENWHCDKAKPAEYYISSRSNQISMEQGSWRTQLELVRDRRTRYLGIGVGSVPIVLNNQNPRTEAAIASDRFTQGANFSFSNLQVHRATDYAPPSRDGSVAVAEITDIEAPLVPDEYYWFDRFQAKIIPIGNDPIAWARKEVIPRLQEESAVMTITPPTAPNGLPGVGVPAGPAAPFTKVDSVFIGYLIDQSPPGAYDFTLIRNGHAGNITPVPSPVAGTIVQARMWDGYGNIVDIRGADGRMWRMAHFDSLSVAAGQSVQRGQTLGNQGRTGHATGPHVHCEIHDANGRIQNRSITRPLIDEYFAFVSGGTPHYIR